ncbi:MAG: type I restriction enzyme HsdR N-terminal domain-containing protein [Bacteroidales bacterium]|nr:type I restriction enzyme HsdR N-terminal domain-containing protein [Bacteroidales bacterium]
MQAKQGLEMSQIFDPIRKKYVARTPEEEVRQYIISLLLEKLLIPSSHIAVEQGFKYNDLQYRADIVVYDSHLTPVMLVECKAPSVSLSDSVIEQVVRYNFVLKVAYIMISNGNKTYLCKWNPQEEKYIFADDIPTYEQLNAQ